MSKPLDEVDRRIIDQLQEEGRRPFTRIARDVGVSEANVRQRVAALTERGVIQIVAATSPIALGMIQAFISVRLSGAGLEEASDRIAAIPEVDYVAVCTGPTDLLVGAVCRDNQHLLEVVTHGIRQVPGVVETDTAVILSELKDSYRFSEATLAGQPARRRLLARHPQRRPRSRDELARRRSVSTREAQLRPLAPVTPPPGWVPAPQR